MSLYLTEAQDLSCKCTCQIDYQYFMTQMEKYTYVYSKAKLPDHNNPPYFLKTSYLHITFHRDICISLMNKLLATNSSYQNVLLQI